MGGAIIVVGSSTVVISFFLGAALNLMWNMLNELQLIIHLPMFSVVFPGNTMLLYSVIARIASFDLIETKEDPVNVVRMFDLNEEEEFYSSELN